MRRYKHFLLLFMVVGTFSACRENKPANVLPAPYRNLTIVSSDSLYSFAIGDTFLLSVGENSCCRYGWGVDSAFTETFPGSSLCKQADQFDVPYPEGCDGCNSYTYYALVCTTPGTDTIVRYQIPMGDLGTMEQDDNIPGSIVRQQMPSKYLIQVH